MNNVIDDILSDLFDDEGDKLTPIQRQPIGLYSFDRAFENDAGEVGPPIGTGYEVYGGANIGKSTFSISLLGMLASLRNENIVLADFEGFDPSFMGRILRGQKFSGKVFPIVRGKDEDIIEKYEDVLSGKYTKTSTIYHFGLFDSISSLLPPAEREGSVVEASMGLLAKMMKKHARRMLPLVHPRTNSSNYVYIYTNHYQPNLGGYGYYTPGGKGKEYLCGIRMKLTQSETFPDGSYVLTGTIKKNRFGFAGREFKVFMKNGHGIHKGLTALIDGADLKIVSRGKTIKIGDQSFGYFKNIILNEWEHDEFFTPFYEALKNHDPSAEPDLSE